MNNMFFVLNLAHYTVWQITIHLKTFYFQELHGISTCQYNVTNFIQL